MLFVYIKKKDINIVNFFVIVWAFHLPLWFFLDDQFSLPYEFSFLLKSTFFFIIYEALRRITVVNKEKYIIKYLKLYYKAATGLICFSFITGLGLSTYGKWGFGTKSFFSAQNDIGITILILFAFFLFNKRDFRIHWLWLLTGYLSLLFMATTTGMLISTAIFLLYIFLQFLYGKMSVLKKVIIFFLSFIALISTTIYMYSMIQSSNYFSTKYEKILEKGVRSDVTNWANDYFDSRGNTKMIFGEGMSSFSNNFARSSKGDKKKLSKEKGAYVERDYHDIKGAYGTVLLSIMLFFYGLLLFKLTFKFLNEKSFFSLSVLIICCLAYLHGFMAGHVFYSPTVAGILASIFILGLMKNKVTYEN
ncbi:O-antigen ligase family protein [Lacinutrix jangbogonensis]|uniref:O-antigen ligase family protein n=1 Tax=Lacinutrix jangbogonensis TaxID=1469557 RepID=UPI00053D04E2|nr:O-antigen ligase family protein [Lacinutrix jangbogonensis]